MLSLAYLRDNKDEAIARLKIRNFKNPEVIDEVLQLDSQRRATQKELDDTLAQSNSLAKQVGQLYREGKKEEGDKIKAQTADLKTKSQQLEADLETAEKKLHDVLVTIPNLPHISVKQGTSSEDNEVVFEKADMASLPENALPHWELAKKYDLIDFETGTKVTGAGFPIYKGKGARLQRALINYFLDEATKQGFLEVEPPILVNEDTAYATGQLPDKEGQMYYVTEDNLYLIPTAEVPVTNIYRDTIVSEAELPIKLTGYTPCFRREAGSYGKDVRGLNRLHQFDKVEIVQIAHPDKSYEVLEQMRNYVASLIENLGLPYRILKLCGGDMGFTSAITYDMEVYSGAQKKWLEVSSVSNFETFQANRLKLRFKDANGKTQIAHTLNGSALALPRIVAALLENNQDESGINIPAVLHNYTGFERID
jgi:seryl-tRNA synthetase